MTAAARVGPRPRRAVATLDRRRFDGWPDRAPGENGILGAEDLLCHGRFDIGGRHRAARRLRNAPGGTTIGSGDFLDRSDERQRIDFVAADAPRQQHLEQARVMQCGQKLRCQRAAALDRRRLCLDQRTQLPRPPDWIGGLAVGGRRVDVHHAMWEWWLFRYHSAISRGWRTKHGRTRSHRQSCSARMRNG
jgi:hypothetical protein